MELNLKAKVWWDYVEEDIKELLEESFYLLDKVADWKTSFHDYAFVVFPAAKAYEGFLKKFFLDLKLIDKDDYYGKHFRIGKALNPELPDRFKNNDYVFDKLSSFCHGPDLPNTLWHTWRGSRNLIFHWFPNETKAITYKQAQQKVEDIIKAIDMAYKTCKIN